MRPRTRLIAAVVAVVLAVAGIAAVVVAIARPDAENVAQSYLDALTAGDAAAAAGLVAVGDEDRDRLVARHDGARPMPGPARVGEVDLDGDRGRAEYSGPGGDGILDLVRTDAGWQVAAGSLASVTATVDLGDSVRIGAERLAAGSATPLLPGGYVVRAAAPDVLVGEARTQLSPGDSADVAVDASLAPRALALAQEQLDAYAGACASPADRVPPQCGLLIPWAADLDTLESIAFRIERHPRLQISEDGASFAARGGVIVATATGITGAGEPASVTYRTDDWTLRGSVAVRGDEMALAVR